MKYIKLPEYFRRLFWDVKFSSISPREHDRRIIVRSVNKGDLEHWRWLKSYYGKRGVRKIVRDIPRSEFREGALKLFSLMFGIRNMKYETRSDYIRR